MPIKMIVTDLDGTLLRSDKTISEYTTEVLAHCRERGILIVFATARPVRAVTAYAMTVKPDAVIYHNGAVIRHADGSTENVNIEVKDAQQILSAVAALYPSARLSAEIVDTLYANYDVSVHWDNVSAKQTDFSDLPDLPVDKLIAAVTSPAQVEEIGRLLPPQIYAEMSDNRLALILNRNATKGNAIRSVTHICGIPLSEVVAFGDDVNDLEMLRICGTGVAVENALPTVKTAANYICGANDEDGVARWLSDQIG